MTEQAFVLMAVQNLFGSTKGLIPVSSLAAQDERLLVEDLHVCVSHCGSLR